METYSKMPKEKGEKYGLKVNAKSNGKKLSLQVRD